MKQFLATLAITIGLLFFLNWLAFDSSYSLRSLSNTLFIVGLFMFFISIIGMTNASEMFVAIGYTFKNVFTRHREKYGDYYEYAKEKEENRPNMFGLHTLIVSGLYLGLAFYLAFLDLSSR